MPNHALIVLTGHIGKIDELKFVGTGTAVLRLSICVNTGFGDKKTASWYDCSLFGKRAETLVKMMAKGQAITVVGEPEIRKWESNGKAGTSVSVRASDIVLLGGKDSADRPAKNEQPQKTLAEQEQEETFGEGVPF